MSEQYAALPWEFTACERPHGFSVGFQTEHVTYDGDGPVDFYRVDHGYDALCLEGEILVREPDRVVVRNSAGETTRIRPATPEESRGMTRPRF